jgi:REP element-mobilizing transposase RayT
MPLFSPYPRRYNSLRLLGYEYNSIYQLCAITLITDLRRPVFADVRMAKRILACLLSEQTLACMRVRAFTLLPDHLHFIAGVRDADSSLTALIGRFKSYTTQRYWDISRDIIDSGEVILPSGSVSRSDAKEGRCIHTALMEWRATLRPEAVKLKNWPSVKPGHFTKKRLWQSRYFDHIIRNDEDLQSNLDYIAMNPVRAGYVTRPEFYPYTAFL